jgi:hypothetical protein
LDRTALLVGKTLVNPGTYADAAALAAGGQRIKFARSLLVDEGALGDDGLQHVSAWGGTVFAVDAGGGDLTVLRHTIRMQLLLSLARSTLPIALGILTPFVEAYRDLFAAHIKLTDSAGANPVCASSRIVQILDPISANALYLNRACLEVVLEVTEKVALPYTA